MRTQQSEKEDNYWDSVVNRQKKNRQEEPLPDEASEVRETYRLCKGRGR